MRPGCTTSGKQWKPSASGQGPRRSLARKKNLSLVPNYMPRLLFSFLLLYFDTPRSDFLFYLAIFILFMLAYSNILY